MDKKNKIMLICGISVASIALLATIISAFYTPEAPDPKELGPRTKVTYMASKQFARLPEAEKKKYVSKMGRPKLKNLTNDERKAVFKNIRKVIHKRMKERIKKFSQMTQEEKNEFLDQMIARRNAMRARMNERKDNGGPDGGNRQVMMQGMFENMDSTTRAQMSEMRKLMREREKQTQGR